MKLGNYLTSLNGANAGLGGYIKSLGIAKLKTIALSIATTALNMVIGAIASAIASFIIKGVTNIINSAENMKKAVDDMVTSYNDSLKTLESHKKTINDIKDDYATLSKGVDELGNNVSLTTDEYKKYQDICNQIADIYPSLIAGHTSEGNAILTLKGNVEALTKAYKDEQKAAAASVISGSDKENTNVVKNYKNESKTGIKSAFKSAFTFNSDKSTVNGLSTTQKISYLERATNLSINELKNKSGSIGSDNVFRSLLKTYGLDTDSTDQEVTTIIQNMKADLSTYQAEVDEAMKGIKTKANAYLIYNSDYDNLNDEQINQISSLIDKALTEEIADTFNKDSDINSKFVQKIIEGIENNKEGISNAYKSLLAIDPNNMGDVSKDKQAIDNYIKKIADYIGTDADSLKKGLGYDVADNISQQYNNIIEEAKKKESDFDWDNWFKEHSVNTQEEIDKWKEIASSANSAAEVRKKYAKQADTFKETKLFDMGSDSAPSTLSKLNSQLDEIQSAYSTLSSAVSEYNSNGNMSIDTMQSIIALGDNWLDYIDMESGAFTLDQEALDKLTQARIEDMKQQALANLTSTVESITTEADATKYLASTNYDAANSYKELAKAKLSEVQGNLQKKVEEGSLSQDSYDKIISKFESDANKISQIFDNTSFKLTADGSIGDSLSELESHADLLKSVQDELQNTSRLSSSTLDSIAKAFPELNEATQKFRDGLMSSSELFALLEQAYNDDAEAYKLSEQNKYIYSNDFWNQVIVGNEKLQNMLTSFYGDDWKNWKNLAEAKAGCEQELVKKLGDLWDKYFNNQLTAFKIVKDAETGMMSVQDNEDSPLNQKSNPLKTGFAGAKMMDNLHQDVKAAQEEDKKVVLDYINQYNYARKQLQGLFDSSTPNLDITTDWKSIGSSSSSSDSGSDSSSEPSPQDFNWVERLLSKISKAYDRLKNKVSDTTRTWLNRNNALSDSMETLLSEINAQSDAYDFYMDRFNSYDLSDYYKDQIANGSFNIETVYDENLKDAISDCQDLYDKAQDAADSVQSLNIEIRQLAKSRFDNIQSQFEEVLGKVNSIKDLYSKDNDLLEEQGWFASTLLNNSMIEQEQKNLVKLEQERDALTKALNSAMASGKIEAESEDWYSMQSAIDDCTSSIYDAKKALVEYDNAIRQINWDAFDRTRDDVSNLIDETQFLVDLLKDEDITDDNGNMNDNGKAAQALIAQKYQLYLNQAKAYKDEILKINEELTNDPYDKELLDRKQELIKAQQEAINSSISEKEALKDLVQEGYDTFLDKLDEVIQKYKDLMNQQKDAYDYEKSIAEKTKALNALEKQYSAVQGDNSEEGKKNIQQLKDQINTAKDDLKDTEYEKLISDTEAILDNLADTTKTWLDERLDSFDITMQEIIDQSNENASNISQTITDTAENYGYKLSESMSNIWSTNASNITNGINSVLGDFSNKFVEGNNAINKVCGDINAAVQGLLKNSNDEAQRVADEIARQQAEQNANTDGGYSDGGGSSGGSNDWSDNWDNSDSGSSDDGGSWGDWFYHLEDDYPKDLLEVDSSIVDRLKYNDIDSSFGARADYYSAMGGDGEYYGSSDQNIWMLDQLKSHGYKNGTKSATAGIHRTDEKGLGSEVIFSKKYGTLRKLDAGDMVFNADQVEKLWNLSKGITTPNMYMDNLGVKLPDVPNISNNLANKVDVEFGDVTLSLPNVKNYEDFMKQMVSDKRFLKAVQEGTLGQVLGRNSLNMLTFR
ncbi:MAG: hypothetical protein ACLS3X_05845 [Lachnospira pectinoschiza]